MPPRVSSPTEMIGALETISPSNKDVVLPAIEKIAGILERQEDRRRLFGTERRVSDTPFAGGQEALIADPDSSPSVANDPMREVAIPRFKRQFVQPGTVGLEELKQRVQLAQIAGEETDFQDLLTNPDRQVALSSFQPRETGFDEKSFIKVDDLLVKAAEGTPLEEIIKGKKGEFIPKTLYQGSLNLATLAFRAQREKRLSEQIKAINALRGLSIQLKALAVKSKKADAALYGKILQAVDKAIPKSPIEEEGDIIGGDELEDLEKDIFGP